MTVAELRVGALLAKGKTAAARAAFVDDAIASIPLIAYDHAIAEVHALLLVEVRRRGTPRGAHDLLIAATAAATGRAVLTADASAFVDLTDVDVRRHR